MPHNQATASRELKKMAVPVIVQARMSSRRLPGKVLREVCGRPMICYLIERLQRCEMLSSITVATSVDRTDDLVSAFCDDYGLTCVRGELDNVVGRLLAAAEHIGTSAFVRISADSPLIDPEIVDEGVRLFDPAEVDIVTNVHPRSFPKGQSVEVISVNSLRRVAAESSTSYDLEHVTPYIYGHPEHFRIRNFSRPRDDSAIQMSVDDESDFVAFVSVLGQMTRPQWQYSLDDLLALHKDASPQPAK